MWSLTSNTETGEHIVTAYPGILNPRRSAVRRLLQDPRMDAKWNAAMVP